MREVASRLQIQPLGRVDAVLESFVRHHGQLSERRAVGTSVAPLIVSGRPAPPMVGTKTPCTSRDPQARSVDRSVLRSDAHFMIICIGSINVDFIFATGRWPTEHEKYRAENYFCANGGAAANTARELSRLGRNVTIVGGIGNDDLGNIALNGLIAVIGARSNCVVTLGVTCLKRGLQSALCDQRRQEG